MYPGSFKDENLNKEATFRGFEYSSNILDIWNRVIKARMDFIKLTASNRVTKETCMEYVTLLVTLWIELLPEIEMRGDDNIDKEFSNKYLSFNKYLKNPTQLLDSEHINDLYELDKVLRKSLKKLKLLEFENL